MVLPFVVLQVALAIALGVLLQKSQPIGKHYTRRRHGPLTPTRHYQTI